MFQLLAPALELQRRGAPGAIGQTQRNFAQDEAGHRRQVQRQGLLEHPVGRDDRVDQPEFVRARRADRVAGQGQLERGGQGDPLGQPDQPAAGRQQPPLDLGDPEDGVLDMGPTNGKGVPPDASAVPVTYAFPERSTAMARP